jgi:hypothetical protein
MMKKVVIPKEPRDGCIFPFKLKAISEMKYRDDIVNFYSGIDWHRAIRWGVMEKAIIEFEDYGIALSHNMPCPVYYETEKAVFSMNEGVFHPSWQAHKIGYRLVLLDSWLKRFVYKHFMNGH